MGIFNDIENKKKEIGVYSLKQEKLRHTRDDEIKDIREVISSKYQFKINSLYRESEPLYDELNILRKVVKDQSAFEADSIGLILAKFISEIEKKNYCCYDAKYTTLYHYFDDDCYTNTYDEYYIKLISEHSNIKEEYFYEGSPAHYGDIIEGPKGDFLLLKKADMFEWEKSKNIEFYSSLLDKIYLNENFDYIYDYIDYAIEYKISNNIDTLDYDKLLILYNEFIGNYDKQNRKVKQKIK